MKRLWISSPRRSSSNWRLSTAACTASVISTKRTARRNATSGTPAAAHASTTGRGDPLAPRRPELDRDRRRALREHRLDPRPLALGLVARAQPGREHQLAALEQVVGVGHLDHVRPAQLATELAVAGHDLRKTAAYDGQLQDFGEREHTNRHALSRKTRRCVHCDAARQTGGSGWPDWRGPAGDIRWRSPTPRHALLIDGEVDRPVSRTIMRRSHWPRHSVRTGASA